MQQPAMPMTESAIAAIATVDIRSYREDRGADRHAYAQLVLPLSGDLVLDIDGKAGRLDPLHGALVAAGAWHAQRSRGTNRSLIVDVDQDWLLDGARARLLERPFGAIGPAARKLVEYMEVMAGQGAAAPALVRGWIPLLLDTLAADAPQPRARLAALRAEVEARPGLPWTTASMARLANLSVSRLHALFREELDSSPHAWLLARRLDLACRLLATNAGPVAAVALAAGFSDQSALTRAMRRNLDATPAAWRRRSRESGSKTQ